MKTLVVFYSRTGNTEKVANIIADKLDADLDEIKDEKNRDGILGFLSGSKDALFSKETEIKSEINPGDYDLVVVGTPVWAGRVTPAVGTYLNKYELNDVVFFCTCRDSQSKTFENMEEISGKPLGTLELTKDDFKEKRLKSKVDDFLEKIKF